MSTTWQTPISSFETNRRRVGALKSLGVVSVGDALTYYPFRVTDPVPARALREAKIGENMAFAAHVRGVRVFPMARRGFRLIADVDDGDFARSRHMDASMASLVFFSYRKLYVDWIQRKLHEGALLVVAGEPSVYNDRLQFTHPDILTVDPAGEQLRSRSSEEAAEWDDGFGTEQPAVVPQSPTMPNLKYDAASVPEAMRHVCRPRPVYHANSRISSEHIHESIEKCMDRLCGDEYAAAQAARALHGADASDAQHGEFDAPQADRQARTEALAAAIPDIMPEAFRMEHGLMHRAEAFMAIHDPQNRDGFNKALRTLRYEEALICQTALVQSRDSSRKATATACADTRLKDDFVESLPFSLTDGQQQVIADISDDMARDYPMQRLLQGEVGSGKTVVAVAAMMQAVGSGKQAVLVAPTQVLAEQHYSSIRGMVDRMCGTGEEADENAKSGESQTKSTHHAVVDESGQVTSGNAPEPQNGGQSDGGQVEKLLDGQSNSLPDIPVLLLTGGMKLAARRRVLAQAASGKPCIVVATHAAFSKTFQAPNLALAVIDEQHRFGVEQRESLNAKGSTAPHLLVMTATPIPRTAAMTWFGDLDISWLTELPGGRKPIRTFVVPEANGPLMAEMFGLIRKRIDAGERAYVVCPRIDADAKDADDAGGSGDAEVGSAFDATYDLGEDDEQREQRPPLHSVAEIAERLRSLPQFAGIRIATLTGRDDDETKSQIMADFEAGVTPILVATTVIEVGVDVAQASCMVIFDADRYGLSQLHQLRGRVGRGGTESGAFLISRARSERPADGGNVRSDSQAYRRGGTCLRGLPAHRRRREGCRRCGRFRRCGSRFRIRRHIRFGRG